MSVVNDKETLRFVAESNRIEGITRQPTEREISEHDRFMSLDVVTIEELERFVRVYQPDAQLRDKPGMDVRVANYYPPRGGPEIRAKLQSLLERCDTLGPYATHLEYETIHPFTDGNGRSGRMLWAWQMQSLPLGFLHRFYYQSLSTRNANDISEIQRREREHVIAEAVEVIKHRTDGTVGKSAGRQDIINRVNALLKK